MNTAGGSGLITNTNSRKVNVVTRANEISTVNEIEQKGDLEEKNGTPSASMLNVAGDSGTAAVTASKHTLCDDTLLKALRLTPSLHTSSVHINSGPLKPSDQNASETNGKLSMSPMKQVAATTNVQVKNVRGRKLTTESKSLTNNKTTSFLLNSIDRFDDDNAFEPSQDSYTIETAENLKRIHETKNSSSLTNQLKDIDDEIKPTTSTISCSPTDGHNKKGEKNVQIDSQKALQKPQNEIDNPQPEIKWTLKEDQLLLEQIIAESKSSSGELVVRIDEFAHRLINRTREDIQNRVDFLIDFLNEYMRNQKLLPEENTKQNDIHDSNAVTTDDSFEHMPKMNEDKTTAGSLLPDPDKSRLGRSAVVNWGFQEIHDNVYSNSVKPIRLSDSINCECKPAVDKCGELCLNRITNKECNSESCPCGDQCENLKIQKHVVAPVQKFQTEKKGVGVKAMELIKANTYIIEYVGEVVNEIEYMKRVDTIYKDDVHHYGLLLNNHNVIDAHRMGNNSRFINHSCEPNAEIQKWIVNGNIRMVLFAMRDIQANEEITFDYKFDPFNGPQKCECGSKKCRGFITQQTNKKSKSDSLGSLKPTKSGRIPLQSRKKTRTSSDKHLVKVLKTERLSIKTRLGLHPNDLMLALEKRRMLRSGLNLSSTSEEMRSNHELIEHAIKFGGAVDTDEELMTKRHKRFADDEAIPYSVKKVKKSDLTTAPVQAYDVRSEDTLLNSLESIKLEWAQNHDYSHAHEQLESIKKDLTVSIKSFHHTFEYN